MIETKVIDFFCGAGGFGLGFKAHNAKLVASYDFDKFACMSYKENVSELVEQRNIAEIKAVELVDADIWTFGFPCQDISIAGKQKGMIKGETRSGLFYEIMRLLKELPSDKKPKMIVAENVKRVNHLFEEIKKEYKLNDYKFYAYLYNTKDFNLPQNRERYFMVGVHNSIKEEFIFKEKTKESTSLLSSILLPIEEVPDKFFINDACQLKSIVDSLKKKNIEIEGVHACINPTRKIVRQSGRRVKNNEEEMFTLTSMDKHGIIQKVDDEAFFIDNQENIIHNEHKIKMIGLLDIKGNETVRRVYDEEGIAPTAMTCSGGNTQIKVLIRNEKNQDFIVRKLTAREYARLQGFPDSYKQIVSDSQFYKQMGNAVSVPVASFVAEQMIDFLKKYK